MKRIIFVLLFVLFVPLSASAQTSESPKKGLLNNHFYASGLGWNRNIDAKDWSGGFSQSGWASVHPNINLGLNADYTLASSNLSAYEFFLSPLIRAHFLPDGQIDPYVAVGFGYGTAKLLFIEQDTFGFGLETGAEIRLGDLVSLLPSITYFYTKLDFGGAGDVSGGYIEPGFVAAFRLGRESRLWLAPTLSYSLNVHGEGLADVFNLGVSFLIQL